MTDVNVIKKNIQNAKQTLDISYNDYYDNMNKIMSYYFTNELTYAPNRRKKTKNKRNN